MCINVIAIIKLCRYKVLFIRRFNLNLIHKRGSGLPLIHTHKHTNNFQACTSLLIRSSSSRSLSLLILIYNVISIQSQTCAIACHRIPPLGLIVHVIGYDNSISIIIRKLVNSIKHLFILQFFPLIF